MLSNVQGHGVSNSNRLLAEQPLLQRVQVFSLQVSVHALQA